VALVAATSRPQLAAWPATRLRSGGRSGERLVMRRSGGGVARRANRPSAYGVKAITELAVTISVLGLAGCGQGTLDRKAVRTEQRAQIMLGS
jgi:hypothetical protein